MSCCAKPCISKEKRQILLSKWNGRFMMVLDLIACFLMLILICLRFYYVSISGSSTTTVQSTTTPSTVPNSYTATSQVVVTAQKLSNSSNHYEIVTN